MQSPRVPLRIRQALDVEAGLNDGLSVPFMMFFIAVSQAGTEGGGAVLLRYMFEQLGMGALVGLAIGLAGGVLLGLAQRNGWMEESMQQLGLVTLPILCVLACEPVGGSMFIAAYRGGSGRADGLRGGRRPQRRIRRGVGAAVRLTSSFSCSASSSPETSGHVTLLHLVYAVLSLTVVRMLPVAVALVGTGLNRATVLFMGWFGPRGLASIVLGLVFLEEEAPAGRRDHQAGGHCHGHAQHLRPRFQHPAGDRLVRPPRDGTGG